MRAARSTSRVMVAAVVLVSGSLLARPSSSASIRIAASGLFTSCATPLAISPTVASFSRAISSRWARSSSVRSYRATSRLSRPTPDSPVMVQSQMRRSPVGWVTSTRPCQGAPVCGRASTRWSEISLHLVLARPQTGAPWHGRVLVTQPTGDRRICDCTITGLSGVGRDNLLVALYDRTDELRAQRELIAREKLATVGEIASGVAHEVNNPLAAIRMEAELLGRASKDPDTSTTAATITREVDRAARIVRSLLRLARRADTTPTRVQMNDLVHDVAEIRQRVLRTESVEFRTTLDQSAPAVLGLGQELQQVVINLVTNAEYVVRGRKPAIVQLRTQAREGWVRLTVDDSGPGVPREIRGRIFDPFFTTKGPDEGTGLGLAICQRVVTEVGGKIWIEDSELGGARFVVELPAAPENVETRHIG